MNGEKKEMKKVNKVLLFILYVGVILSFISNIGIGNPDCGSMYYNNYNIYGEDVAYDMHRGCSQAKTSYYQNTLLLMIVSISLMCLSLIGWGIMFIIWCITQVKNLIK